MCFVFLSFCLYFSFGFYFEKSFGVKLGLRQAPQPVLQRDSEGKHFGRSCLSKKRRVEVPAYSPSKKRRAAVRNKTSSSRQLPSTPPLLLRDSDGKACWKLLQELPSTSGASLLFFVNKVDGGNCCLLRSYGKSLLFF